VCAFLCSVYDKYENETNRLLQMDPRRTSEHFGESVFIEEPKQVSRPETKPTKRSSRKRAAAAVILVVVAAAAIAAAMAAGLVFGLGVGQRKFYYSTPDNC
jgi:hypothetical protein